MINYLSSRRLSQLNKMMYRQLLEPCQSGGREGALLRIHCQLDKTYGHLRGEDSTGGWPRSAWPVTMSGEDC